MEAICRLYDSNIKTPWIDLPEDAKNDILNGTDHKLDIQNATLSTSYYADSYEGLIKFIEAIALDEQTGNTNKLEAQFFSKKICPECKGDRLNKIALHYYIDNKSIGDVARMDISELYEWTKDLEEKIDPAKRVVAIEILKEINSRLRFLLDVGLDYLSLNRSSASLSGGESQRIRLATQIGTQLINVLYILDEPSIVFTNEIIYVL